MSLIEKIDAEIKKLWEEDDGKGSGTTPLTILGLLKAKDIILSEQNDLSQKLNDIYNEYPYKVVGRSDTYSKYNEAWTDAIYRVAEVLGIEF